MRKIPILLVLLLAAFVLGACSGATAAPSGVVSLESSDSSASGSAEPSASVDPEEAMLAFTKCMRDEGIDLPDPGSGDRGVVRIGGEDGFDPEEFQAANDACRHHLDGVIGEDAPELTPEQKDAMLEFAQCMREHGVDMPDPGEGGVMIGIVGSAGGDGGPDTNGAPGAIDPNDPTFQEAEEACRHLMTDAFPDRGGPGSGPAVRIEPGGGDQ
jgi:hypothetical protein